MRFSLQTNRIKMHDKILNLASEIKVLERNFAQEQDSVAEWVEKLFYIDQFTELPFRKVQKTQLRKKIQRSNEKKSRIIKEISKKIALQEQLMREFYEN